MKAFIRSVLLIFILCSLLPLNTVLAVIPYPQLFYGSVTLDGTAAPDGTSVTVQMNGRLVGSDSVSGGSYGLLEIQTEDGDKDGDTLSFYVNGLSAGTTSFSSGERTEFNLSATSPLPSYTLTIGTSGGGNASGAGTYTSGTVVNITASAAYGWVFSGWSGETSTIANTSSASTTITMNADYSITANFVEATTYTLTILVNGEGTTNPVAGEYTYIENEMVTVDAIAADGWEFESWTGDVADINSASTSVTMTENKTITANFAEKEKFTLTMAINGQGSVIPAVGEHEYTDGDIITIKATPAAGWLFASWTGDVEESDSATTTVTMDENKTVTANFVREGVQNYTLTINISGNGTVNGAGIYEEGTVVDITATPDDGWVFLNWTGDVANPNSSSTTVTMNSNKTVTANFVLESLVEYTLTILTNGNGSTNPAAGEHKYTSGTVVNITATPADGWLFQIWTGDVANPNLAGTTVTMNGNKTITAIFMDTKAPEILLVQSSEIGKTEAYIIWITNEPCTSQVEYWASPRQFSATDNDLVSEHLVHLTGLTPATTYNYRVISLDAYDNEMISETFTFTTLGSPASFSTADWNIALSDTENGKKAIINYTVSNTGDLSGTYTANLLINGLVENTKTLTLPAEASEHVSFTVIVTIEGTYQISVDSISFTFTLPAAGTPTGLIIGICLGILLLIALTVLLIIRKRRSTYTNVIEDNSSKSSYREKYTQPTAKQSEQSVSKSYIPQAVKEKVELKALEVTKSAAQKLKDMLLAKTKDKELGFRLTISPSDVNQLTLKIDTVKPGDSFIDKDGTRILIIDPSATKALEGKILDYQEGEDGAGFIIR